jgi:chaperonin GroES
VNLEVKVGDRILFAKYGGTEVKIDDQEFLIMREEEILGIISAGAKSKSAAAA